MALDVKSLAAAGFAIARTMVPDLFKPAIIRLGPDSTVDVETDEAVTRWKVEIRTNVFSYEDEDERKDAPANTTRRSFLLNPAEYPPDAPFLESGEVECDGTVWAIYKVQILPGTTGVIFHGWQ